jgi:hypothetical protein
VAWSVKVTEEYAAWFTALIKDDLASAIQVAQAVAALREEGPTLGRPLVDRVQGSRIHRWYRENIPVAEQLYVQYTTEE